MSMFLLVCPHIRVFCQPVGAADTGVTSSRTTTAEVGSLSTFATEQSSDIEAVVYELSSACAQALASYLPHSYQNVIARFAEDPVATGSSYFSFILNRVKRISVEDIRRAASWIYVKCEWVMGTLPVKETMKLFREQSRKCIRWCISTAQDALRNAQRMCQNQLDEYCARHRKQGSQEEKDK